MKNIRYIALAILLAATSLAAQKKAKPKVLETHVVATYTAQGNEKNIQEVRNNALKAAQLKAIEQVFGTSLSSTTGSTSTVDGDKSSTSFHENTHAEVRGEWVEDTKAPVYKMISDDPLTYQVEVWGTVREIVTAKIDITYKIYDYKGQETTQFTQTGLKETSHVFLDFFSPVKGNLVVYLLDETEDKAYLMLPYKYDTRPAYPIEKGETVTFFKDKFKDKSTRMRLTTPKEMDYFQLYLIFSPNDIFSNFEEKAKGTYKLNTMSIDKFHDWLTKAKNTDKSMIVNQETITLTNNTFK